MSAAGEGVSDGERGESERLIRSQEVPRKPDRNTQSTIYLFTADMEYAVNALIDFIYVIILNLRCRQKDVVMKKAVGTW